MKYFAERQISSPSGLDKIAAMLETLRCEPVALVKLLLHAAKYSSSTINGILLGQMGNGQDIYVSDVIPLFHTATNLAMPTEIALSMVGAAWRSC